jgi:hypothetical protein
LANGSWTNHCTNKSYTLPKYPFKCSQRHLTKPHTESLSHITILQYRRQHIPALFAPITLRSGKGNAQTRWKNNVQNHTLSITILLVQQCWRFTLWTLYWAWDWQPHPD